MKNIVEAKPKLKQPRYAAQVEGEERRGEEGKRDLE
jgi:hypothetical protein